MYGYSPSQIGEVQNFPYAPSVVAEGHSELILIKVYFTKSENCYRRFYTKSCLDRILKKKKLTPYSLESKIKLMINQTKRSSSGAASILRTTSLSSADLGVLYSHHKPSSFSCESTKSPAEDTPNALKSIVSIDS